MQSVQRHFGKYMKRSADESQISVLLKDFEDADLLLAKVHTSPPGLPIPFFNLLLDPSLTAVVTDYRRLESMARCMVLYP
jgi:hypothetical protein